MTSNLRQFYGGQDVFITGGTSTVGVPLLAKLLRDLPDLGTIYLLLRSKEGHSIHWRYEELKNNTAFEKYWDEESVNNIFNKIKIIDGDIGKDALGLTSANAQLLLENVSVVFHLAAELSQDSLIKPKIETNVLGTRRLLEFCERMPKIKAFVHVSSSYANIDMPFAIKEEVYPLHVKPENIVKLVTDRSETDLAKPRVTSYILGNHCNSYTLSKQMAELEVQRFEEKFPCAIVRPGVVTGAWKEPSPGWTHSNKNIQGFLNGVLNGVLRRIPANMEVIFEYVPVDVVVNHLIVAGCHTAIVKAKKVEVSHCTTGSRNPFRWGGVVKDLNTVLLHAYPLKKAVWYPYVKFLPNIIWFYISAFFIHFIPALFFDFVLIVSTRNPMLVKKHWEITKSIYYYSDFMNKDWRFETKRTEMLEQWLSPQDCPKFDISISDLNWRDFILNLSYGIRKYLNKENDASLKEAKKKHERLFLMHRLFLGLMAFFVWYTFSFLTGLTLMQSLFVVPVFYFVFSFL